MPLRNFQILFVAAIVSVMCYVMQRRTHSALIVGQAIDSIVRHYVDPVDERMLLESALVGVTSKLDEHSQFIPPSEFEQFEDFLTQEFAGIGILVEQPDEGQPVRVITPLVGSPALRSGMLPGDRILQVDGVEVSQMKLRQVSDRLRGPVGTKVQITIQRDTDQQLGITVTRAQIPLDSVVGDYRDDQSQWVYRVRGLPRVAMIRCTSFGEKTVAEMRAALKQLDGDFDALILDLRGNSGGLLSAAVEISDMFIVDGEIVSTRGRDRTRKATSSVATKKTLVAPAIPMAVLIDGNSASASEIVSACLQDHGRAAIVGTRSYGKGTVQNLMMMEYGRSAFKLTTARYYRPNGGNIHRLPEHGQDDLWGVSPDPGLEIELSRHDLRRVGRRWRRATYPVFEDIEITASTDLESTEDAATLLELPESMQLPGDEPEESPTEAAADDIADETVAVESGDEIDPDAPANDPQLQTAIDYLLDQIDTNATPEQAA